MRSDETTPTPPSPVEPTPEALPTSPDANGDDAPSAAPSICTPAQDANGTCPK